MRQVARYGGVLAVHGEDDELVMYNYLLAQQRGQWDWYSAEVGEDVAWMIAIPPARRDRLTGFRVAVLPALDWVPEWDVLLVPAFITPAYSHWDKPWPNTRESIRKTST